MYEKPNDDENFYRLDRSFTLFKLFMTHFLLLSNTSLACYVELLCYKTVTNMWTHYCITTGPFIYIQGDSRPLQQTLRHDDTHTVLLKFSDYRFKDNYDGPSK